MIGQRVLLERIGGQIERKKFPRFSILIGEKGSGKKTMAKNIAQMLGAMSVMSDIKVESIREIIDLSYRVTDDVVYIIPDCDNMSSASANALLKVTEEPPKNAYFILTCENEDNLLSTIRSRGVTYMLEPYTYEDKCDYIQYAFENISERDMEFMLDVASTPGELYYLADTNIQEFKDYINLVVDNIAEVSDSNAFKIGDKVAFKDEPEKYDIKIFWKAFNAICVDRMREGKDPLMYARAIGVTGDFAQQLNIRGINKQMLFDNWLIAIREEWV